MTLNPQVTTAERAAKMQRFLDGLASGDLDAWGEQWAPDGVMIAPYDDDSGSPARFEGRQAVVDYFKGAVPLFGPFAFDELVVQDTVGNVTVAEWRARAELLANGATYENRFVAIITYDDDGLVTEYRQYRNPNAFARAANPE